MNNFNNDQNNTNDKKNSAIDKVEQNTNNNESTNFNTLTDTVNQNRAGEQQTQKTETKTKKAKLSHEEKEKMRQENAKQKAENKINKAKASTEKQQADAKVKLKKAEEKIKQQKLDKKLADEKKQARIARKQIIKNETKPERLQRLATEKQIKAQVQLEKTQNRAKLKEQKQENHRQEKERNAILKAEKHSMKANHKAQRQEEKARLKAQKHATASSRGIGGWLAAVISLGSVVIILGSVLTVSLFTNGIGIGSPTATVSSTQRAFYDFVGYMDNIDVNMSKMLVSEDTGEQQRLLSEIRVQSNLACTSLGELPLDNECKYYTTKLVNQLGDYSKYLNNRLIEGDSLKSEDKALLSDLSKVTNSIRQRLADLTTDMDDKYTFKTLIDKDEKDIILSSFMEMESNSVEYPQMIYDGPFSDNKDKITPSGLEGDTIDSTSAKQVVDKIFADYGIKNTKVKGEAKGGTIDCYNIEGMTDKGEIFAQVSMKGGKLIMFNSYHDTKGENISTDDAIEIANEFISSTGIKGMQAVWLNSKDGICSINFASTVDGVVCYSDLVKVNVDLSDGRVIDMEANSYYLNFKARKLASPKNNIDTARAKVSSKIDIETERLAIIPLGKGTDRLCYEFMGTYNSDTYYVYIDALTLKEVEIFKVIRSTEGQLLL